MNKIKLYLDRLRYEHEMKHYTQKCGNRQVIEEIEKKRPKKALSAYMIFVRETRPKI